MDQPPEPLLLMPVLSSLLGGFIAFVCLELVYKPVQLASELRARIARKMMFYANVPAPEVPAREAKEARLQKPRRDAQIKRCEEAQVDIRQLAAELLEFNMRHRWTVALYKVFWKIDLEAAQRSLIGVSNGFTKEGEERTAPRQSVRAALRLENTV